MIIAFKKFYLSSLHLRQISKQGEWVLISTVLHLVLYFYLLWGRDAQVTMTHRLISVRKRDPFGKRT